MLHRLNTSFHINNEISNSLSLAFNGVLIWLLPLKSLFVFTWDVSSMIKNNIKMMIVKPFKPSIIDSILPFWKNVDLS